MHPVPGLYTSIEPKRPPPGWQFKPAGTDERFENGNNVLAPDNKSGYFVRIYDPAKRELVIRGASRVTLPKWIHEGIPLVPGKGTPTQLYITLRQMREQGVPYGGLRSAYVPHVGNARSKIDLDALRRTGSSFLDAVRATQTYEYIETNMIQSGHRIESIKVRLLEHNGLDPRPNGPVNEEILKEPLKSLDAYRLEFTLAPFAAPAG